jgi:D-alanyl-D-alanine carboxypeptidase
MSNKLKIFLISFLISSPIWWGTNIAQKELEDFFFSELYIETPRVFTAQVAPQPKAVEPSEVQAKAAFSVKVNEKGTWQILYQKNIKQKLPIASLTKLMTALVVLENYQLDLPIKISKEAVKQDEDLGQLKIGETLTVKDLLYIMLIESSNDAAYALAEVVGIENFVDIMNWEVKNLGLKNTHFSNPNGLDDSQNYSTAQDLAVLTKYLLDKPLIWEILRTPEMDLYLPDGTFHHRLKNTNQLLEKIPQIFGGKTGWSPRAQGCFILILKDGNEYSINIILGAEDRFAEMKKLLQLTTNQ